MEAAGSAIKTRTDVQVRRSARLQKALDNNDEEPDRSKENVSVASHRKRASSKESTQLQVSQQKRTRISSSRKQRASLETREADDDGYPSRSDYDHMKGSPIQSTTPSSAGVNFTASPDLDIGRRSDSKQLASSIENSKERSLKRKRQSTIPERSDSIDEYSLIGMIKYHTKLVHRSAKAWVERYEAGQNGALVELLTILFEICGVSYRVEEVPLDNIDVDDVVLCLVARAKDGPLEDYLGSKQRELRNFKDNVLNFWDTLVLESQNGPLFDGVFMDKCMDYIIAISCTPPRVFRQVTTLVGLQIVTSLVTVAKNLSESRKIVQRQLNAEKKKKKDGPRVESLNKSLSETHEKITMAEEMMRKIFTGLFMHRYRDVDPDIRTACIVAIGSWILSYPSLFLQDLYLKYIGWTLNDKHSSVRKASIIALQNLYEVDDNVPSLGLFTERFCKRMIELADDIDVSVAVTAIGLLKQLLRHQLLEDEDLGRLYDLLIDESPQIRHAIGDLVYDHLILQKFSGLQSTGADNESSEVQLERLLHILREFSSDPVLSDCVIDAVWDKMNAMKDWKCIASMLLDDNPRAELTDQDSANLARVLCASAKKAVGEKLVLANDGRKANISKLQKEKMEANRRDLTVAMMTAYSKLLRKYVADKSNVATVVEVVMYMNLELYSLKQQEKTFTQILQLLKDAFFKHGEENILKACVKALFFCASESQADLQGSAQQMTKLVEDELVHKLRTSIKYAGGLDDEYSMTVNLRRLHQLQLQKCVPGDDLFADILGLLGNFNSLTDEVICLALLNMFLHIAWCLKFIDPDNPDEAAMSSLISKRISLMKQLESFADCVLQSYAQGNFRSLSSCMVCVILSDLWGLFSQAKLAATKLQTLGFCPSERLLEKFWKICEARLNEADNEDDEEEDVTDEHLDYLNQKDVVMSAAAKLIAHEMVPVDFLGPEILSHFVLHGKSVAETVKYLLAVLKKNMKMPDLADLFLEAIKRAYGRHIMEIEGSEEDWSTSRSFLACKELASRLSATFSGYARNAYKSSICKIVKGGIKYAFVDAPNQLTFLEAGVLQFALKLPPTEVQEIIANINKRVEGIKFEEDPSSWRPYLTFVDYLKEKAPKITACEVEKDGNGSRQPQTRLQRKLRVKGKKLFEGNETTDDEQANESGDHAEEDDEVDDTPLYHVRHAVNSDVSTLPKSRKSIATELIKEAPITRQRVARRLAKKDEGVTEAVVGSLETEPSMGSPLFGSATEEQLPVG